jgi:hypothetical protein
MFRDLFERFKEEQARKKWEAARASERKESERLEAMAKSVGAQMEKDVMMKSAYPDPNPDQNPLQSNPQEGGGFVTLLGRRRKIVMQGRKKCVRVKGELIPLKDAKCMDKKNKLISRNASR